MIKRDQAIDAIFRHTDLETTVFVVGNGDLSRRVASRAPDGALLVPLEGAMGMAPAVALGVTRWSGCRVVVLEGDGNSLLGAPASDWALCRAPGVLQLRLVNGVYATSGGQQLPIDDDVARSALSISDLDELIDALRGWAGAPLARLIRILELDEDLVPCPRPTCTLASRVNIVRESLTAIMGVPRVENITHLPDR